MDLYFEMNSGIAGDMTIAALLDLGASKEKLVKSIDSLGIGGYELVFNRKIKNGIDAYNFDVILENCDHKHVHKKESHDKESNHHHSHSHEHRHLKDIEELINKAEITDNAKENALGIFDIIADAEAKAHGIDKNDVHFHEVGAMDSIIDIIGTAVLLDDLDVENIYFSNLSEGYGYQNCAHGQMPIPVPAVVNILAGSGINIKLLDEEGEHVTPTGAAIVRYFDKGENLDSFKIKRIGLGAGNRDFDKYTNILRIMEIETGKKKTLELLETNIDDSTGEILGFLMDECMNYALDVFYTPIFMKKNRPAYKLSVICDLDSEKNIEDIIFKHSTSIGIRKIPIKRDILDRKVKILTYDGVDYKYKIVDDKGERYVYPEFESAKELSKVMNIGLKTSFDLLKKLYYERENL